MNLFIISTIIKNYLEVSKNFTIDLFKALKPPLLNLQVNKFDGCKKGDEVHLEIGMGPIKSKWVSVITSDFIDEEEATFLDEGKILPWPFKTWKHSHRILKTSETECEIHDDIEYSSGLSLLDKLIYPMMYFQFSLRTPVYKSFFNSIKT